MSQAEWERKPSGGLRKESVLPNGLKIKEGIVASAYKVTREIWPDAQRTTYSYPPALNEATEMMQNLYKKTQNDQVFFTDRQKNLLTGIELKKEGTVVIRLTSFEQNSEIEDEITPDALVTMTYKDNKLVDCELQAEVLAEKEHSVPEDATWQELFPTFLNLRKTTSIEELQVHKDATFTFFEDYIRKNSIEDSNPKVQQSLLVASELVDYILNSIPVDDRDETLKLLKDYGWDYFLAFSLLGKYIDSDLKNVRDVLNEDRRDEYLNELMRFEMMTDPDLMNLSEFKHILKLTQISTAEFRWEELEIEVVNMDEQEIKRSEGNDKFNTAITVQDHVFRVEKADDKVVVTCSTNRGKVRWTVSFPMELSTAEIVKIGNDLNVDFRDIKLLIEDVRLETKQ